MKRPSRRVLSYLAPALLVLVACVQMLLVRTHGLTAWKGGGFGMFSTTDAPTARALRLVLVTEEGEAVVPFPNLRVRKERMLNFPSEGVLRELAAEAVREDWVVYTYEQAAEMGRDFPDEFQRQFARTELARRAALEVDSTAPPPQGRPRLIAFPYARRSTVIEGRRPALIGARAEAWRLLYDPDATRFYGEPVRSVAVEAAR